MSPSRTTASLQQSTTEVPVDGGRQLTVPPGSPWPSAYRGSEYSIVSLRSHGDAVQWSHMGDIQAVQEIPDGLKDALDDLGKSGGYGSFKLTASGEVLTKVPANEYNKVGEAPANRGHIPVYVGQIEGTFDFQEFSNDPTPRPTEEEMSVWTGLPFNHGESWSVCTDDTIRWNWQDYYFESAFEHPELVEAYKRLRPVGGVIYINEHGHVWGNVDRNEVPSGERECVVNAFREWQQSATNAERRLVTRRLKRTESDAVPDGLLPVYLGHLNQFDDGVVPKPIVDDKNYFNDTAMDPDQ